MHFLANLITLYVGILLPFEKKIMTIVEKNKYSRAIACFIHSRTFLFVLINGVERRSSPLEQGGRPIYYEGFPLRWHQQNSFAFHSSFY